MEQAVVVGIVLDLNDIDGRAKRLTVDSDLNHYVTVNIPDGGGPIDEYLPWKEVKKLGTRNENGVYYVPPF